MNVPPDRLFRAGDYRCVGRGQPDSAASTRFTARLSLIVVMVALAGLYLLMGAEFVAAVQIIVYGGAIMVLFVFVIMLLNAGVEERTNFSSLARFAGLAAGGRADGLPGGGGCEFRRARANRRAERSPAPTEGSSAQLFQEFVYPFELTSFLILVAIIGAIVLAQRDRKESHL